MALNWREREHGAGEGESKHWVTKFTRWRYLRMCRVMAELRVALTSRFGLRNSGFVDDGGELERRMEKREREVFDLGLYRPAVLQ